jgi:catechol 2,3-dioxygenase-like lactoylglutathione lyase family enzyme
MAQATLTTLKASSIDHVVLHVRDVDRAKKFYIDFLGLTVAHEHGRQSFLRCGNQLVALFEAPAGADIHAGSELNHLALKLEEGDYDQVSAALKARGIRFWGREGDPHCIYLEDPDGHRLQLITTDHRQRRQHAHS